MKRIDRQLLAAAKKGDTEKILALLEQGADVNADPDDDMGTPLMRAATNGHINAVQLLLEKGADINEISCGRTALTIAAEYQQGDIIRLLLERGAAVDDTGEYDRTALMHAAHNGMADIVKLMLEHGADANATRRDFTVLIDAAQSGSVEAIRLLLDAGAKINAACPRDDSTALMHAVARGKADAVRLLLERGADANQREISGVSALSYAAGLGDLEIFQILLEKGAKLDAATDGVKALMIAVLAKDVGDRGAMTFLLEHGVDVNAADEDGDTALHHTVFSAAMGGRYKHLGIAEAQLENARFLIERGADVNQKNNGGATALMTIAGADYDGASDFAQLLLDNGADVNATDHEGCSALFDACTPEVRNVPETLKIMRLLIERGADVNVVYTGKDTLLRMKTGDTPLILAARQPNMGEAVKLLLAAGADVNACNAHGDTALSIAAGRGHGEIAALLRQAGARDDASTCPVLREVDNQLLRAAGEADVQALQQLLDEGANVNAALAGGDTSLTQAARRGHLENVRLLLARGADASAGNALYAAVFEGHDEIIRLLLESGANINECDGVDGEGTLHFAARMGRAALVRLLVEHGADVNVHDSGGVTPLIKALLWQRHDIFRYLIKKGADIHTISRNPIESAPLIVAARQCQLDMVKLLVEKGVDVNVRDCMGCTPLMLAAAQSKDSADARRYAPIVQFLIEHGADVNARDDDGGSVLSHAAKSPRNAVTRLLKEAGAL